MVIVFLPSVPFIQNGALITQNADDDVVRAHLRQWPDWYVIDATAAFNAMVSTGHLPRGFANTTLGVGHLNADGHTVVGQLLAAQTRALTAMSFVSVPFALLLPSLLLLLWIIRIPAYRKLILLLTSCVFYAYWDWRFLGLLALVTVLDYSIAHWLALTTVAQWRRGLLLLSIVTNLGFLAFFKYCNFFIDNLNLLLHPLGRQVGNLAIIFAYRISFYTFETLSYVIDVYRGTTRPIRSLLDYAIFITFFPAWWLARLCAQASSCRS